jgi:ketosteroid isomerase-like protein
MNKLVGKVAGLLLLFGSSACLAQTEELVAVVDLKFLKTTEQVVVITCWGHGDDECYPSAYGSLYEAQLRRVISGEWPKRKFLVIYGGGGRKGEILRGVIGKFSALTDGTEGAKYQIVDTAVDGDLACFDWNGADSDGPAEQPTSGQLLRCVGRDLKALPKLNDALLSDPEKTLRAANDAYNKALIAGDFVTLEKIFATEFVYTSTSGEVIDRAAQLQQFKSGTLDIVSAVGSEEKVQIHTKTGIIVGRFDAKGTYAGKPFDSTERYTSVWVARDGRWQLLAEQGTLCRK